MLIVKELEEIPSLPHPIGLTIGSFDGVHLGHQKLLQELKKRSATTAALTFSNHPAEVLSHRPLAPAITSLEEKLELLEKMGIDLVILLKFSDDLVKLPFDEFLKKIRVKLPFALLLLGEGAAFGSGKRGDEEAVKALARELNFQADYLPKQLIDGRPISSGWIREALSQGDLPLVKKLLGRKYDI